MQDQARHKWHRRQESKACLERYAACSHSHSAGIEFASAGCCMTLPLVWSSAHHGGCGGRFEPVELHDTSSQCCFFLTDHYSASSPLLLRCVARRHDTNAPKRTNRLDGQLSFDTDRGIVALDALSCSSLSAIDILKPRTDDCDLNRGERRQASSSSRMPAVEFELAMVNSPMNWIPEAQCRSNITPRALTKTRARILRCGVDVSLRDVCGLDPETRRCSKISGHQSAVARAAPSR